MSWRDIASAPLDGTVIDLWMVDEDGTAKRVADAYYVASARDHHWRFKPDGSIKPHCVQRGGWWAPGFDYEGEDGWADCPRWFNEHPRQNRWVGRAPTHWMPKPEVPTAPTPDAAASEAGEVDAFRDLERAPLAALHRLQHTGSPAAKPKLGGSILQWAADEIVALRAALTTQGGAEG